MPPSSKDYYENSISDLSNHCNVIITLTLDKYLEHSKHILNREYLKVRLLESGCLPELVSCKYQLRWFMCSVQTR